MTRVRLNKSWIALAVVAITAPLARAVDDLTLNVATPTTVQPGDVVSVQLNVSNLAAPINGVQALMQYDDTLLTLQSATLTNLGLTPPASGWDQVVFTDGSGAVTFAASVNGGSVAGGGTVATFDFLVIDEGTTSITFQADSPPFLTKLTRASDSGTVLPNKFDSQSLLSTCDDGVFCNGSEFASGGVCQAGTAPDCSGFTDQCNSGVCNESLSTCEAVPANEGLGCDDGDLCTTGDVCTAGACVSTPVDCSGLTDICNNGVCNAGTGACEAIPINEGGSCDDGVFCTGVETCQSGACVSSGDPCAPLQCDELAQGCFAPINIDAVEVYYAGQFSDAPDPTKACLGAGATADATNITNFTNGVTGIRVIFNTLATFATTPANAFSFEWTTGTGTTFAPMTDVITNVSVTASDGGGFTVVDIVMASNHARKRWVKITVDATQVTSTGIELDGELSGNPIGVSGDGTPGGDAVFYLGNMPGDADGNRITRLGDVGLIRAEVNPFANVPITNVYDVNKDGKVQLSDVGQSRTEVNPFFTLPLITP